MSYHIEIKHRLLNFRHPAKTSRGAYITRDIWYMILTSDEEPDKWGVGECAPLPDLSCDWQGNFNQLLQEACHKTARENVIDPEAVRTYPSLCFALETAFQHYRSGSFALWDTPFSRGEEGILMNGLVWMSNKEKMIEQAEAKIKAGFTCIKFNIGALDFADEIEILRHIRTQFNDRKLEIRVDANGAFSPGEAPEKLSRLAEWDIHSIEQPIAAGQWEAMAKLIQESPIPIALDEELIGIHSREEKCKLMETIRPDYIVLKPSLHGGFRGSEEWIEAARNIHAGWWITSALESNIGLNAIAQWCATLKTTIPQGLGTGALYTDNIEMPLVVRENKLWYDPNGNVPSIDTFLYGR